MQDYKKTLAELGEHLALQNEPYTFLADKVSEIPSNIDTNTD